MTAIARKQAALHRRRAILALLFYAESRMATVTALRADLEAIHGQIATRDRVRADLIWLRDIDMVRLAGDAAMLTEHGVDVVMDRTSMPGEMNGAP